MWPFCYGNVRIIMLKELTQNPLTAMTANRLCFPGGAVVKSPPANAGDTGLIPGSGRSPGEGNGNSV